MINAIDINTIKRCQGVIMNDCKVDILQVIRFLEDKLLDAKQSNQLLEVASLTEVIELLAYTHHFKWCPNSNKYIE